MEDRKIKLKELYAILDSFREKGMSDDDEIDVYMVLDKIYPNLLKTMRNNYRFAVEAGFLTATNEYKDRIEEILKELDSNK